MDLMPVKKNIVFYANGYRELGMGHIYHCITLAKAMRENRCMFITNSKCHEGIVKLREVGIEPFCVNSHDEMNTVIQKLRPDIWVNDNLDTESGYILWLKDSISRVVTIEDLGPGSYYADAVINAVYEHDERPFVYSGWKYVCLREEFQNCGPQPFRKEVRNVLLMFGGTDPSNYNRKLYDILLKIAPKNPDIRFEFVTGLGYDWEGNGVLPVPEYGIDIHPNVEHVTEYMSHADIAITSQGRTIYELAAMGVPSIVLAQNQREQTHTFAQMDHGFLNLGLRDLSPEMIANTLDWLINTPAIRKNMYDLMIRLPLRDGLQRVVDLILGEKEGRERESEKLKQK